MMTASGIRVTLMKERGLVSHCGLNTERKYKFKSPIKKKSELAIIKRFPIHFRISLLILTKVSLSISHFFSSVLSHDYYPCLLDVNLEGFVAKSIGLSLYKTVRYIF